MKILLAILIWATTSACGAQASTEAAPPAVARAPAGVARAPAAVENSLIIGGRDLSWATATQKECPDETTSPGRLEAAGADEYSCAGRSYKTLFQSKDFVALVSGERHKALREWMQSDAKSRAAASGDSSAVWRHEMASIEIAYA